MTAPPSCRQCASPVDLADRFCEACGAVVAETVRIAVPDGGGSPDGTAGPCPDCGNASWSDGYCTACGNGSTVPDRDEGHLDSLCLITDRGLHHAGNEDAAAAGLLVGTAGPDVIAVAVSDGVSTSTDAHLASAAAATAGVDAMLAALAASRTARSAVLEGLAGATAAAARAGADDHPSAGPSCTYTGAAIVPTGDGAVQIAVGNVGDSRAYWLPVAPAPGRQLTLDDSVAQELIAAGVAAESMAVQRGAHTLTRWLGADSGPTPWADSNVTTIVVDGPGVLVLCTDGLWNYLPDVEDLARFCTGTDPTATARALVEHALHSGGHDNVTAAVIQIGEHHEFG